MQISTNTFCDSAIHIFYGPEVSVFDDVPGTFSTTVEQKKLATTIIVCLKIIVFGRT